MLARPGLLTCGKRLFYYTNFKVTVAQNYYSTAVCVRDASDIRYVLGRTRASFILRMAVVQCCGRRPVSCRRPAVMTPTKCV